MSSRSELPSSCHRTENRDCQLRQNEIDLESIQDKDNNYSSENNIIPCSQGIGASDALPLQRQDSILSAGNSMLKVLHIPGTEIDSTAFSMERATSSSWQPLLNVRTPPDLELGFSPRPPAISTFQFPRCVGDSDYVIVDKDVLSSTHEGSSIDNALEIMAGKANRHNSNAESILSSSPDMEDLQSSRGTFRSGNIEETGMLPRSPDSRLSQTEEFEQISIPSTSDEEMIETDQISNIIPSFIMPKVSVISLDSSKKSETTDNPVNIQIVGRGGNLLIHRLCAYKKTLGNVAFQLKAKPIPNIILWIVDSANCVLPQVEKRPVLPVWINSDGKMFPSVDIGTAQYFVCKPLKMKSLNDDLMTLIDFLSCLGKDHELVDGLLYEGRIGSSMALKSVNLVLIKSADRKVSSTDVSRVSTGKYSGKSNIRKLKNQRCRQQKLKVRIFVGFSFGIVSVALIVIWKGLGVIQERIDAAEIVQIQAPRFKQLPVYIAEMNRALSTGYSRYLSEINTQPMLSWQRYITDWDNFLYLKMDNLAGEFEELSQIVSFRGLQIFQRLKLFVENIVGIFDAD